jgi:hypothetical protein
MVYRGERTAKGCKVWCLDGQQQQELPLRLDLENHSPTGPEWGYPGSGPAQLALALLAHTLGDDPLAVSLHQAFKDKVVVRLPQEGWQLTGGEIRATVQVLCLEDLLTDRRRELDRVQGLRERTRRERDQARAALAEEEEAARGLQAEGWELKEQLREERRQHGCCSECGGMLGGSESLPEPCQTCLRTQGYLLADVPGEPDDLPGA